MSEEEFQSDVTLRLTKHISSACRMCRRRNAINEGFIEVTLRVSGDVRLVGGKEVKGFYHGAVMYCTDCYEMLRKVAVEDCKEFVPFYELVYEESVKVDFPPELVASAHDAFQLWRRKVDKEAWLAKLAEDRAEADNP